MNDSEVLTYIDRHRAELIEFARELVAAPSVNPPGDESQVAGIISGQFRRLGLAPARIVSKAEHRPNLIGTVAGNRSGPVLMYCGHMDTKPVGDRGRWQTDPFDPVIRGECLYGLGSADMKGGLAAMIYAAAALDSLAQSDRGSLLLVLTADEEAGGASGAEYVAREAGLHADIGLIGEPVGISREWEYLGLISRGETCFRVKVHGTQMHSSIADLVPSVNANVKMAEVLTRLARELRFTYQSHPLCPQGVTMGPGVMVSGGVSYGVLPGYAEFATEVRLLPGMTVEGVKRDVQQFLSEVCADDPDLDVEVEFEHGPLRYIAPVVVSEEHPFVRRLQAAAEQILGQCPPQGAFPAWTDARFFDAISGIRTIPAFGPGLLVVTHAPNEHVRVESIVEACKIYALAAASYLTGERETIGSRRRTKRGGALGD